MDINEFLAVLEKLSKSSLPDTIIWAVIVLKFVLVPAGKRLNGLSLYIKRYLVIQRKQAGAFEKLSTEVACMLEKMADHERRVRKSDYAQTMPSGIRVIRNKDIDDQ
jgi:hypothetical protein